jgi:hypothetical protein
MKLIGTIMRLARSPQGRQMLSQAGRYARSPEGRARLDQVRRQIASRRKAKPVASEARQRTTRPG